MTNPLSLSDSPSSAAQRILIVDDDEVILRLMKTKFKQAGFEVQVAVSGREALDVIEKHGLPHLAIVDINMPGMNGFEFCETVQQFADLPVIMLSAIDEEDIVIQGIQHYAEDYVTKPFSPRELVARVERVLRRIGDFAYALEPITHINDHLAVNFAGQQAIVGGKTVSLTPTETKLLYILIRNAGHVVSNAFLLRRLWPLEEVFEDTLRVHIYRLRHKIEPLPGKPRYILTERGLGYRFPRRP